MYLVIDFLVPGLADILALAVLALLVGPILAAVG